MANLRDYSGINAPYWSICREERNLAAILYHLLLLGDNLQRFLDVTGYKVPLSPTDSAVYFEYAYLRDIWFAMSLRDNDKGGLDIVNERKRAAILSLLRPQKSDWLGSCSVKEFNDYFGGPTLPSPYIQSPSNWSLPRYACTIDDKNELLRVSMFKWAFNAKPDLVIHADADHALCVEAKFESRESSYPTSAEEKAIFKQRDLRRVKQTDLQRYLMKELLGIETDFVLLVADAHHHSAAHRKITWAETFASLRAEGESTFVTSWLENLLRTVSGAGRPLAMRRVGTHSPRLSRVRSDGTALLRRSLDCTSDERRGELERLCGWAEGLEQKGLCRLSTSVGTDRWVLRLDLPGAGHGLVVIHNDNGAPVWLHGTVFARRAPVAGQQVQQLLAPRVLSQRTPVYHPDRQLLDAIEAAYREAHGLP